MNSTVIWRGEQVYKGIDKNGNQVVIDPTTKADGSISPPDLLLMSLGSCKGIFFNPAVKEMGLEVQDFEISLTGEKSKQPNKLFNKININFRVWGDVTEQDVQKAIEKADTKCFIAHSLDPEIVMETSLEIVND